MQPLRPRMSRILIALSLLTCALTTALSLRSIWHEDGIGWKFEQPTSVWHSQFRLHSAAGIIMVSFEDVNHMEPGDGFGPFFYTQPPNTFEPTRFRGFLGFNWEHEVARWSSRPMRIIHADVPYWFIIAAFGFGPALSAIRFLSRQQKPVGSCVLCGYDLRATPDRCPECGTIPSTSNRL